jgi:transcription elongation factor GreA
MADSNTYISAEGLLKLEQELEHRVKVVRPEISGRISEAREMGDLSENFAYHDARDQQGINETRINELQGMLRTAVVVSAADGGASIRLGASFQVKIGGQEKEFKLVGESEADPMNGRISNSSPLGAAFINKKVGDVVSVTVPSGVVEYSITAIH